MDKFKLILSPKTMKDLDSFSDSICIKITNAMKVLEENPFPRGKLIKRSKEQNQISTGSERTNIECFI